MPGGYYGKDGTFYKTWEERKRADAKWDQQERQTRELKNANELSKKSNELAEKNLQVQKQIAEKQNKVEEEKIRELKRQNEIEEERLLREEQERNEKIKKEKILNALTNDIFPIMEMSLQVKDPVEYLNKISELYLQEPQEPIEKELYPKVRENINTKNISYSDYRDYFKIPEIYDKMSALDDEVSDSKFNRMKEYKPTSNDEDFKLTFFICLPIIIIAICFLVTVEGFLPLQTTAIIILAICVLIIFKSYLNLRKSRRLTEEYKEKRNIETENLNKKIKDVINQVNNEIDIVNAEIEKENAELFNQYLIEKEKWENKIKNFEARRLKNFDYPLELALEKFSELNISLGYSKGANYILRHNDYPEDYTRFKEDFYRQASELKAKESGTEIFENLDNSEMNDIIENEQENYITFNKTFEQFCEDFNEALVICYEKFDLSYIEEEKLKITNIDLFKLNSSDFDLCEYNESEDLYRFIKDNFKVYIIVNNINNYITRAYIVYEQDIEKETDEIAKRLNTPFVMALTNKNIADAVAVYKEMLNQDDYTLYKEDIYYELNCDDYTLMLSATERENNSQ